MDVGIIGLGSMGRGMAARLIQAGHRLRVWNRTPEPVREMEAAGAVRANSAGDAFTGDAAVTMLADDAAVRAVILNEDVLAQAPDGFVHVVSATISVELAKELEQVHRTHRLGYVAAPVLGRPDLAAAGELNVIAAGDPAALRKVQPLLDAFAKKTWPVATEPHKANVAKLAMNFLLLSAIESMAEALTVAEGHALDPAKLVEIMTNTTFAAPAYKIYGELILRRKFTPAAFRLTHGLKDVKLALAAAELIGAPMPFASVLRDNLLDALVHGGADQDLSALAGVAFRRAGR